MDIDTVIIDYTCLARHYAVRDGKSRDLLLFVLDSHPEAGEVICEALGTRFPKKAWSASSSRIFRTIQAVFSGEKALASVVEGGELAAAAEAVEFLKDRMAKALSDRSHASFVFSDASSALSRWHHGGMTLSVFNDRHLPDTVRARLAVHNPEVPVAVFHTGDRDLPEYSAFLAAETGCRPENTLLIVDAYAFEISRPALSTGFRIMLLDRHWVTRSYYEKGFGRYIASLDEVDLYMELAESV